MKKKSNQAWISVSMMKRPIRRAKVTEKKGRDEFRT